MHNPQVSLRFGLILEAYLRGAPNHTTEINRQVTTHSLLTLYIQVHVHINSTESVVTCLSVETICLVRNSAHVN